MFIDGIAFLEEQIANRGFSAKAVMNEHGAVFFPSHLQHRDQKAANVSYEDNYAGNALAAMIAPGRSWARAHFPRNCLHMRRLRPFDHGVAGATEKRRRRARS